jgi:hypothetical protein
MNSLALLAAVQRTLKNGPCTLDQLVSEHASLLQQLGWSAEQVSLWLACLPSAHRCVLATGEHGYAWASAVNMPVLSLADELVALLRKAGRPMPLIQLMSKLPAGMVVTEPMLRACAQQDARLELKGPLMKLT